MKKNKMNKMYLVLGDVSDNGHGKYDKILLKSNVSVKSIQRAYKDSCELTGVSFNNNEDFTKKNRSWEESDKYRIAHKYEDSIFSKFIFDIFSKYGLTKKMLDEWDPNRCDGDSEDGFELCIKSFVELWIWFVKLSLPKNTVIKTAKENDKIPCINGYSNKNLNVQFGYGLFS